TFSAQGRPLVSSEALIGVAVGGSVVWVSGGGSSSHASDAGADAGACADAVQPNNPTIAKMPVAPLASESLVLMVVALLDRLRLWSPCAPSVCCFDAG